MSITLPVCDIESNSTRQLVPKPKWFMADAEILQRYKSELDSVLKPMRLPLFVSHLNYVYPMIVIFNYCMIISSTLF